MNSPAGADPTAGVPPLQPLTRLRPALFETPAVLKKAVTAGRQLAELKGQAASMPNQGVLVNTLALQEANHALNAVLTRPPAEPGVPS